MSDVISKAQVIAWLETCAGVLEEKKAYLTELDAAIGDGDHGLNMARGFGKVKEKLPSMADASIGSILNTSGMALISSVGGASGPLYGTFFMRASSAVQALQELEPMDLVKLMEQGIEGVIQRGRAEVGEKTMLDALIPAVKALKAQLEAGVDLATALDACVAAAEAGVQSTIPLVAKKGRASYLGERSVGHQDPGATSSTLILSILRDVIKG
jgi:phosphoenolpyruvate---glycerone phosphotransferase subunit DhaL